MGLMGTIFRGQKPARAADGAKRADASGLGVTATRSQLVRMAYQDTMRRHGIPEHWLGVECMTSRNARGLGVHARLVVRAAEDGLLAHLPQVMELIRGRLLKLDRTSQDWLSGTSVRFDLPESYLLRPMPPVGFWAATPARQAPAPKVEQKEDSNPREWLERLLSSSPVRQDLHQDFRPTQPMYGHPDS